jgi:hypothetical protein
VCSSDLAEFEDILERTLVDGVLARLYGITNPTPYPGDARRRFANRVTSIFKNAGKPFSDVVLAELKLHLASAVAQSPATAIAAINSPLIDSVVHALEGSLARTGASI